MDSVAAEVEEAQGTWLRVMAGAQDDSARAVPEHHGVLPVPGIHDPGVQVGADDQDTIRHP
ncbi:hypothetical protein CCOS2040_30260 [Streptomyces albidoflavus]|nr:hypothetical protein Salbus254_0223 [Streptomyces albidoflavus]CAI4175382.1 hypothetical protein CCOS2040_30260 [Streptomyces albidoflavus]